MKKHNQTQKKDKENNITDKIKIPCINPVIALSIMLSSLFILFPLVNPNMGWLSRSISEQGEIIQQCRLSVNSFRYLFLRLLNAYI